MEIETGDLVVERRNRDPLRPLRQNVRHRRDERTEFRPDIAQEQDRVPGAARRRDLRRLDLLEYDCRIEPALHQDRVFCRIGADPVESHLAVKIAFRRSDLPGQLAVEKA